jgi:adenylate kinase family enzyme
MRVRFIFRKEKPTFMAKKIQRIYIIGNSASGKTSLAKRLSKALKIKAYDLDDFYWQKKFTKKRAPGAVEKLVKKATHRKKWIIEGVYSSCVTCSLDKADVVIWLDYPFRVIAWQLIKRQIKRGEKLSELLDFLHYVRDYYRKPTHRHYERNESNYYKHKRIAETYPAEIVHITSKKELEHFVNNLRKL